ncbi:uncharacterized protein LOC105424064 [Pogonomyrmex barbatus]|uniref:Uncharacterized protein LOC105424064 n=1 Tax=Pogonomyrmex barbatus TaxID=144034 RepID=A0A6I9W1Z2_9HYME|nr:uncharacterized protein LOC105424064 [Pogonomyrmex barbatus]
MILLSFSSHLQYWIFEGVFQTKVFHLNKLLNMFIYISGMYVTPPNGELRAPSFVIHECLNTKVFICTILIPVLEASPGNRVAAVVFADDYAWKLGRGRLIATGPLCFYQQTTRHRGGKIKRSVGGRK